MTDLLARLKVKHRHSSPYYPQCNGLVEKVNGILVKIISKQVEDNPKNWDKHLTTALWAYRTSFKVSTQFTPFHLVYGQEALLPIEVEIPSYQLLIKAKEGPQERWERRLADLHKLEASRDEAICHYIRQATKRKDKFNKQLKDKGLKEKMLVLRYDSQLDNHYDAKFSPRWEGPFIIYHKYKNGSYQLQDLSGKLHKTRVNGWRLKPYLTRIEEVFPIGLLEDATTTTKEPPDLGEFTSSLLDLFHL